jgi:UDP-2,3-diacylglucosamine hydrolase
MLEEGKYIYFASDAHFGLPSPVESIPRERLFVKWLDEIQPTAAEIYLLGDMFDFWFEYKYVVPRGFTRMLGKIAEITDSGIPVHFFTGNHDLWVSDYLPLETGMIVHKDSYTTTLAGKRFYMAHGDGLGSGDPGFRIIKWVFNNKTLHWLFSRLHPNFAVWMAHKWSHKSRYSKELSKPFMGEDREHLVLFSNSILDREHVDFFVYGHRHIPLNLLLKNGTSRMISLGDWLVNFTYAVFDGKSLEIKKMPES